MPPFLKQVDESKLTGLQERLEKISKLSADFLVLLCGSTLIATLGLFLDSPGVIIGAMIIAPLMRPLIGLSLATLTGDSTLLGRAGFTLFVGTLAGVFISLTLALLFRSLELTPEILSRTHPTLLDMGVAIFAGAIGAYCHSDEYLSDSLAGVAISVALVPPLSVVGIGLAYNSYQVWSGAALLYATNLIGITVAGALVFLVMGFIPLHQAKRGLAISAAVSLLLIVPLGLSMRELILQNQIRSTIKRVLKEKTFTFRNLQLRDVKVERFKEPMLVLATIYAPEQPITSRQVALVRDFLIKELKTPIEFRLQIIPLIEIGALELVPATDAQVEQGAIPNTDTQREPQAAPNADTHLEPQAVPNADTKLEPQATPNADTKLELQTTPNADTKLEPQATRNADTKLEPQATRNADTKLEPRTVPNAVNAPSSQSKDQSKEKRNEQEQLPILEQKIKNGPAKDVVP